MKVGALLVVSICILFLISLQFNLFKEQEEEIKPIKVNKTARRVHKFQRESHQATIENGEIKPRTLQIGKRDKVLLINEDQRSYHIALLTNETQKFSRTLPPESNFSWPFDRQGKYWFIALEGNVSLEIVVG